MNDENYSEIREKNAYEPLQGLDLQPKEKSCQKTKKVTKW